MGRRKITPEEKAAAKAARQAPEILNCAVQAPIADAPAEAEFEHVTDGTPCPCEPEVISYADPVNPRRISGDELKERLRQERREARLAEKGY